MINIQRDIKNIKCNLATVDELNALDVEETPLLSYSSITNFNRCPTLGVLSKSIGREAGGEGRRAMALEAGSVCHEVYSVLRLYQLIQQDMAGHAWHHAGRILGDARREQIWHQLDHPDPRTARYNFAMEALYTSGFTDDAFDRKRTFANIEDSLNDYINYCQYDKWPIFVLDHEDTSSFVGVEIPVVLRISFYFNDDRAPWTVYIDGVVDGIHYDAKNVNRLIIQENKTTGVMDDTWIEQFTVEHQITMYALMASMVMHREIRDVHLYGMPIPCGRKQVTTMQPFKRESDRYVAHLFQWAITALEWHFGFKDTPLDAPRFTHSCRRFFRTCSMMPICAAPRNVQEEEIQQMPIATNNHLKELLDGYKAMHHMFSDERMQHGG